MALAGKIGAVYRSDSTSTAFTDEATTKDTTRKVVKISDETKRFWDDTAAVTVKKNDIVQSLGFSIEHAGGYVIFDSPLLPGDVVKLSGKNFNVVACAGMFNWKLDINTEIKDSTTFASAGWKEVTPVTKGWTVTAEGYWTDETFLTLLGQRLIFSLYVDVVNKLRYEGYVNFKKTSISAPSADLVKESIEHEGTGKLFYHY